ncbi:hypothetical protein ACFWBI_15215 [Streptomyces sp. NPDC059982]|uniref:hypothetical protein n=2 Tax=unclassified Streptomyces TaxID=2593676 RepID=UPI00368F9104
MPYDTLTDRDERELLRRAENRISRPLPVGAVLGAVRALLARRPRGVPEGRESLSCQPKQSTRPHPSPGPSGPLPR